MKNSRTIVTVGSIVIFAFAAASLAAQEQERGPRPDVRPAGARMEVTWPTEQRVASPIPVRRSETPGPDTSIRSQRQLPAENSVAQPRAE